MSWRFISTLLFSVSVSIASSVALNANTSFAGDKLDSSQWLPSNLGTDPRFRIRAISQGPNLRPSSVYMNAIAYLSTLAQEPFEGALPGFDVISMAPWNDVGISAIPTGRLERRYVIWGVHAAIDYLADRQFQESRFQLLWEDVEVGRLQFDRFRPRPSENYNVTESRCKSVNLTGNSGTNIDDTQQGGEPPNASTDGLDCDDQPESNAARIVIVPSSRPGAAELTERGMYSVLAGTIMQLATLGTGTRVNPFSYGDSFLGAYADLSNTGPSGTGTRAYTNGMAARAIFKLAKWVELEYRYAECAAAVKLAGRPVGVISISKEPPPSGALNSFATT